MSFLDLYQGDIDQAAKIQPNEGTRLPSQFDENFHAAWSDGRMFGQSVARANARASVLGDYIDEIRQKTGNDLSKEFIPDVAGGGQTGVTDFDTANERVSKLKESYPDLDLAPLSDDEIDKRALAKAQAAHRTYETLQQGEKTWGGSFGSFAGSAGAAATDPINVLALAVAPETGGIGILGAALRWGGVAAVSQAAIEVGSNPFKEEVQPGYTESGLPTKEIAGAFLGGAVLGGTTKALGNAWTRVKTGQWPRSVRDAGNVVESEANVASTNPFPGVEGEVAHREALVKTIDDILAGRPVAVDSIITPQLLERSRALVEKLQTEQPMALPVINRRAIELVADEQRLSARDAELASTLETLPAGDASAADRLNRLQAVDQQIAEATDPAAKRALNERRDQILVDTNPEALRTAAAPIEQRRAAESERASIADQLHGITEEHARMQAGTLSPMKLPALGQRERVPTGPKGQFELELKPPAEEPAPVVRPADLAAAPHPPLQTTEQMGKTLTAPDHQEAIRADIDRAIADRATGSQNTPRATFTTAKGSTYSAFEDGTTIRNKAARSDVGHEGDSGIKPRTAKTIYVDGDASVLSGAGLQGGSPGGKGYRVAIKDGKATFLWWNEKEGKWGAPPSGRDIPFTTTPEVGKSPVELWKPADDVPGHEAYRGQHAGNKITSVVDHPKPPTEIMVPGVDENGNHAMVGVDKAMDEVDAYKALAEQIQACARPVEEVAPN